MKRLRSKFYYCFSILILKRTTIFWKRGAKITAKWLQPNLFTFCWMLTWCKSYTESVTAVKIFFNASLSASANSELIFHLYFKRCHRHKVKAPLLITDGTGINTIWKPVITHHQQSALWFKQRWYRHYTDTARLIYTHPVLRFLAIKKFTWAVSRR